MLGGLEGQEEQEAAVCSVRGGEQGLKELGSREQCGANGAEAAFAVNEGRLLTGIFCSSGQQQSWQVPVGAF